MNIVLKLDNVSKTIRKRKIIDGLSFEVRGGEVFGLLGPNGAGKTTTIRMIAGLIQISSGNIAVCGYDVAKEFESAIQHVGAIVENPELYKFLTGYENLQQVARLNPTITKEKIEEMIELVGLKNRVHDKVKTYSLGMRQRLGIAQSLLHGPKVLILDEPTNGLDPAGIREIRDYLRNLAREKGLAIIVSSHLLSEMEMMCDRIAIIQNGKLINVQNIREEEFDQEASSYLCVVGNQKRALRLLIQQNYDVIERPNGIELKIKKKQVPEVMKYLVNEHIHVYEMKRLARSLEDRFLEITKNEEVMANV